MCYRLIRLNLARGGGDFLYPLDQHRLKKKALQQNQRRFVSCGYNTEIKLIYFTQETENLGQSIVKV